MDNVRIAILDRNDQVLTFMDNTVQDALHYYDDSLHEYVEGSAYTYDFKTLTRHEDSQYLVEGGKISFTYRNRDYYANIVKIEKTEQETTVSCYGLLFELLNEEVDKYESSNEKTIEQYLSAFNFANGVISIGINEMPNKKIKESWTSRETVLKRLYSLAEKFGAEFEFRAVLNDNFSLKELQMNVYYAYEEGKYQGIGQDRRDEIRLRYGKEVEGIRKKSDISELFTAIRPFGKDGLTITGISKSEYDADGNLEFITSSGSRNILAVQACEMFPSNQMQSVSDRYMVKIVDYNDIEDQNALYKKALEELKTICVPKAEYEVTGYFDTDVGDIVEVEDAGYEPTLYLSARVSEQVRSFTDMTKNSTKFTNVIELQEELSVDILERVQDMLNEVVSYSLRIVAENGSTILTGAISTTLTARVYRNGEELTETQMQDLGLSVRWTGSDGSTATGKTLTVQQDAAVRAVTYTASLEGD